ncbi:MAG: hypothetical protein U5J63_14705 [Fodinibius sp.]|nr:hypothetical protein [Fodinibius sp.]
MKLAIPPMLVGYALHCHQHEHDTHKGDRRCAFAAGGGVLLPEKSLSVKMPVVPAGGCHHQFPVALGISSLVWIFGA